MCEPGSDLPLPAQGSSDGLRKLLLNGSVYAMGRAGQLLALVLVLPVLTRVLNPSEYGRVVTALVVVQVLGVMGGAGLPVAITVEYFRGCDGPARARSLVVWAVATGTVLTLVAEASSPLWARLIATSRDLPTLRIACLSIAPLAGMAAVQGLLQAQERPRQHALVTLVGTAGAQALGLGAVVMVGTTSSAYFVGMATGVTVATLLGLTLAGRGFFHHGSAELLRSAFHDGLPTVPHDLSMYLIVAGDRLVLQRVAGPGTVGRYQIAYVIGSLGVMFVSALVGAWLPIIYGAEADERWQLLASTTAALYRVGALVAGLLALGAPFALMVMAPPSFRPLGLTTTTAIISLSILPYITVAATVLTLLYLRRARLLAFVSPTSAFVNIVLNAALAPYYGMQAAAVLTVVTYGFQAVVLRLCSRRHLAVRWQRSEAVRSWVLGLGLVIIGCLLPTTPLGLGIRALVGAGILTALVRAVLEPMRRQARAQRVSTVPAGMPNGVVG